MSKESHRSKDAKHHGNNSQAQSHLDSELESGLGLLGQVSTSELGLTSTDGKQQVSYQCARLSRIRATTNNRVSSDARQQQQVFRSN